MRQKILTLQQSLPPQNRPYHSPFGRRRCLKCQGHRHTTADCPNRNVITLAEWEAVKECELEEKKEEDMLINQEETQEEVEVKVDEGEIILLGNISSGFRGDEDEKKQEHQGMFIDHKWRKKEHLSTFTPL